MKLYTSTFKIPLKESRFSFCLKMPFLDKNCLLNSSSPQVAVENSDENKNGVTAQFIENFSGLKLEADTKSACEKSGPERKVADRIEAKISIEEKNTEIVCLSCSSQICCEKSGLTRKEEEKINLPLSSDILIERSPDRIGRKHCKERLACPVQVLRQRSTKSASYGDNFSLSSSSPTVNFSSQYLHCNGGSFSEANVNSCIDQCQSLCRTDRRDSLQLLASVNFTDDPFSPSSISSASSSAYSSSPSSYDYLSPNSVTPNESEDSGHDSPSTEELYPSPPNSAFGDNSLLFDEIPCNIDNGEYLCNFDAPQFTAGDDSLPQCPFLEDNSSTDLPPKEKINDSNVLSHSSVPREKIEQIVRYLKNGNVNPITSQLVKNFSESLAEADSSPSLVCANNSQEIRKDDSKHVDIHTTQLPSTVAYSSFCRSENAPTQPIVVPFQLTVAVVGPKEKHQRRIKPSIVPVQETRVEEKSRCQNMKEPPKRNPVLPGGELKSVKDKISASMSREEKNILLKSELEKKPPENGETRLHLVASKGDEKLAYLLVELMRTKLRNEKLKTDNPRIFMKEKIRAFVNIQNKQGLTPLYYAVFAGNSLLTAYLLECGADPFIKDYEYGNTSYHVATTRGDSAIILMELLSYCRNISDVQNNKGQTILMAAVMNHSEHCRGIELIKHLLRKNHMLTPQDCDGRTALHIAVMKKDIELVELLLTYATDAKKAKLIKDNNGNTVLHVAATLSNIQMEIRRKLLQTIIVHCPSLTQVTNKESKLPYELIEENRIEERNLLRNRMDEFGFRNL